MIPPLAALFSQILPPATSPVGSDTLLDQIDLGKTFQETTLTGWGMLLLAIFAGVAAGKIVSTLLKSASVRLKQRGWETRGTIIGNAAGPASLALIAMGLSFGLAWLSLSDPMRDFTARLLALLYITAIAWFLWNLVDLADIALRRVAVRHESYLGDMIVPLIRKTLRVFLILVFVLFTAENVFGADITAWLAGLGIAGLAVSLAAQESIKNLFGSVTIFLDRPFGIGDRISFAGYEGTVEEIGFRSTKLRTLVGHVVTIPNSKIVDGSVENVARRLSIRRLLHVTITYDTSRDKVVQATEIIKSILADPQIASAFDMEKFPPRVAFDEFNADSLNIRIFYWFHPNDYWAYLEHAQRFNLMLLDAFNEAGIDFAFPTRTLHLAGDAKRELSLRLIDGGGPQS